MTKQVLTKSYPARRRFVLGLFMLAVSLLLWRAVDLQVINKDFYRDHGDARALRVVGIPAHRGNILDRNGEPLAISTPVDSVWARPERALEQAGDLSALAQVLAVHPDTLVHMLKQRIGREFVYLKRHLTPDQAAAISALDLSGVYLQREYKRYYPTGEVTAHLIGFTNIDDQGQEGIELAYDHWLRGTPGSKRVLKNRIGQVIKNIESIKVPEPGKAIYLSIDRRLQYLAYRELKSAVALHKARSATLVMLDANTGEILAMAVQPSYNPNNRSGLRSDRYRNRAVTDVFEPGSTLKPFTVMTALASGLYTTNSLVETNPGSLQVGGHTITDIKNYGTIDLARVITKSSNVASGKLALSLGAEKLWTMLTDMGFGQMTGSGYPGESAGLFNNYHVWSDVDLATIAFGHGIAVTTLQLAQAYSVIATGGILRPVSLQRMTEAPAGQRVLPQEIVLQVRAMMEAVVQEGGSGLRAAVRGYRIAGKTGTAHKAARGGYAEDRYLSLFAGMAPVSAPRLVLVVVIDEPSRGRHFGGQVAAPVFANVMEGALRILNIPPDDLPSLQSQMILARQEGVDEFSGI